MKTKILRVLCLLLVISMVVFPVNAAESNEPEFQLQGAEVTLYDEDVTVEIPFITPKSYGIEGVFSLTAAETNEIALTKIDTAFEPVEGEDLVNEVTGEVMWVNNDFNGPKEDELVTGVYTIPADTAEGEYTVSFELRVFTGEDYEPIEPNETYTATIKVKKHVCSDVTTDEDHLCDDPNCKNQDTVTEHTGGVANCVCGKVCDQCGKPYTSIDQENHYSDEVSYVNVTEETHTVKHSCCEAEDAPVPHDFTNGDCVCGAKKPAAGMKGDVDLDGDVDAYDLTMLARHIGGIELISDEQSMNNADVDEDGDVDAYDLTRLARYIGGIITDWSQE